MNNYNVIKKPLITEKSHRLAAGGKYVFEVALNATKGQVSQAVETLYKGVKVSAVAITRTQGKKTSWRRKGKRPLEGVKAGQKKAIVTLSAGKIELFEGESGDKKKS